MAFSPTEHPDVKIFSPQLFQDNRGVFFEFYNKLKFTESGINYAFVQDNFSSSQKGVLRGLHYQIRQTQGKLVSVLVGDIFDVAVDLRRNSPYFGKWVGMILSEKNKNQLWIPPGFAHGFYVLSDRADVFYKITDHYDHASERTILWDDPDLKIEWPIPKGTQPILSEKDASGRLFREADTFDD